MFILNLMCPFKKFCNFPGETYFAILAGQSARYWVLSSKLDSSRKTLWSRARREIITESAVDSRSLLKVPDMLAMESLEELVLPEPLPPLRFCGGSLFGAKAVKTE